MTEAEATKAPIWKIWKWKMHWQVLLGIVLGLVFGWISGSIEGYNGRFDHQAYGFIGGMFMDALKMLVIPLVAISIIASLSALNSQEGFARLGGKTIGYYVLTSSIAILIGLALVNLVNPGQMADLNEAQKAELLALESGSGGEDQELSSNMASLESKTEGKKVGDFLSSVRLLVPSNLFEAMVEGNMLGIIFFAILVGIFTAKMPAGTAKDTVVRFWGGMQDVILRMTVFVLAFLPLGVWALIAKVVASSVANEALGAYINALIAFVCVVLGALILHLFGTLSVLLALIGKVNPLRFFKALAPAGLAAFSTASSAATLPVTMECLEDNAGVSKRVTSFVAPVGATVNMDGTALYECVAVMFLAQLAGIDLSFAMQLQVVALSLLTSIGVAGVPSASLVAIVVIVGAVNAQLPDDQQIPVAALAIILIFDRLLDMCRTAVNVMGDASASVVIARTEGEKEVLQQ